MITEETVIDILGRSGFLILQQFLTHLSLGRKPLTNLTKNVSKPNELLKVNEKSKLLLLVS